MKCDVMSELTSRLLLTIDLEEWLGADAMSRSADGVTREARRLCLRSSSIARNTATLSRVAELASHGVDESVNNQNKSLQVIQ